jgi:signal transduction histidine kinase
MTSTVDSSTVDKQHSAAAVRRRLVPWSPHAWGQAISLAGGIPAQVGGPLLAAFFAWAVIHRHASKAWPVLDTVVVLLALLYLAYPALTWIHRHRMLATAGVEIGRQQAGFHRLTPRGFVAAVRSEATWRQLGYHLVAAPALGVAAAAAVGLWVAGLLYSTVYIYGWALNPGSALYRGLGGDTTAGQGNLVAVPGSTGGTSAPAAGNSLAPMLGLSVDVWLTVAGLAALFAAPWLTAGVQTLDVRITSALLGPSRTKELQHRVEHLTQTRAGVVDAADAERRRLERDLHDGTQQRLVSLAMNLGIARAQAVTEEDARQAIVDAHEEAKAALAELRDLIRGLHPAVLEDRGLDAALSGVTARMAIPVRLSVEIHRRPAAVIEAVAYFVVSEGLANIAKHAQASQAEVVVTRSGDRLHVIVSDDGNGGADPARGTGLAGLARRVAAVDGTFDISSPPGGPTLLTVDLPCTR